MIENPTLADIERLALELAVEFAKRIAEACTLTGLPHNHVARRAALSLLAATDPDHLAARS